MPDETMDVQFRNPFYHNRFGLLGGAGDEDTVYVLPSDEVLPRSAKVLEGGSTHRKENAEAAKAAKVADVKALQAEEERDEDDEPLDPSPPRRVKPKEGATKTKNQVKKRKR
jgi:hypothetical protein